MKQPTAEGAHAKTPTRQDVGGWRVSPRRVGSGRGLTQRRRDAEGLRVAWWLTRDAVNGGTGMEGLPLRRAELLGMALLHPSGSGPGRMSNKPETAEPAGISLQAPTKESRQPQRLLARGNGAKRSCGRAPWASSSCGRCGYVVRNATPRALSPLHRNTPRWWAPSRTRQRPFSKGLRSVHPPLRGPRGWGCSIPGGIDSRVFDFGGDSLTTTARAAAGGGAVEVR
jgi:hypothetical protein